MTEYWVSAPQATCQVNVDDGRIVMTAPVWRKFIGQPFANLRRWLERNGGPVWVEHMENTEENTDAAA